MKDSEPGSTSAAGGFPRAGFRAALDADEVRENDLKEKNGPKKRPPSSPGPRGYGQHQAFQSSKKKCFSVSSAPRNDSENFWATRGGAGDGTMFVLPHASPLGGGHQPDILLHLFPWSGTFHACFHHEHPENPRSGEEQSVS